MANLWYTTNILRINAPLIKDYQYSNIFNLELGQLSHL